MLPEQVKVYTLGGSNDLKGQGNLLVHVDRLHPNPRIRDLVAKVLEANGYKPKEQKRLPRDFVLAPGRRDDLDQAERDCVILDLLGEHLREVFTARGVYLKGQAELYSNQIRAARARAEGAEAVAAAPAAPEPPGAEKEVQPAGDMPVPAGEETFSEAELAEAAVALRNMKQRQRTGPRLLPVAAEGENPAPAPRERKIPVPPVDYSIPPPEIAGEAAPEIVADARDLDRSVQDVERGGKKKARRVGH